MKNLYFIILFMLSAFYFSAKAQNMISDTSDISNLDIDDLMKVKIATNKEQSLNEAPSIVSIITRKDIEAYGCRDISDVLRLIPGFEYGIDVVGNAGLGFRGIWVHEGKALLMLNDLPLNDFGFGNFNCMGTLPVAVIERVEIIRGPGSALYGGFAEVCVINVITTPPKNTNGVALTTGGGIVGKNGYALNSNLSASGSHEGLKYNFNIGYSEKPLSNRQYTDFFGNSYQMNNVTAFRKWYHIITELSYKGLSFNFQRTSLDFNGKDGFYIVANDYMGKSQDIYNHSSNAVSLKYDAKLGSRLKITPLLEFISGNDIAAAYSTLNVTGIYNMYATQSLQRYKGQLTAQYDFRKFGELTIGGGYIRDVANNASAVGNPGLYSAQGDSVFSRYTESKYIILQHQVKIKSLGFTLGNRYENTSFGEALAPRVGVTFLKNKFNSKILYGKGYRIPLPWQAYSVFLNYDSSVKLTAEISSTIEFEIGYKFNQNISAKVNAYYIDIDNPIVYIGVTNSYQNFGTIVSKGIEAELNANYNKVKCFLNFSSNSPGSTTSNGFLTGDKKFFLGLPVYKINLGSNYQLKNLIVGATFTYLSKRYGESPNHAQGLATSYESISYIPILLTNLNMTYKNLLKKVDINLSIYNLLDQKYVLIQPYYGAHAPLPANDRQITLGLKVNL